MLTKNGDEVLIRQANDSDAAELARLRWELSSEKDLTLSRDEFIRDCGQWLRKRLRSGNWFMAVAESGSGLCGCMFLQFVEKVPEPGSSQRAWGYVTNSYVDPQKRGHGIGEKLLRLLISVATDHSLELLIVWPSEAAVPFYQRAGFKSVSEVHVGADNEPPLEMMLPVAGGSRHSHLIHDLS